MKKTHLISIKNINNILQIKIKQWTQGIVFRAREAKDYIYILHSLQIVAEPQCSEITTVGCFTSCHIYHTEQYSITKSNTRTIHVCLYLDRLVCSEYIWLSYITLICIHLDELHNIDTSRFLCVICIHL